MKAIMVKRSEGGAYEIPGAAEIEDWDTEAARKAAHGLETGQMSYNGWTNYETWNVALWIDNHEGSYRHWRVAAQECYDEAVAEGGLTRKENAAIALADMLKASIDGEAPELGGCYGDLLSAALSAVNWHEIARNWMDDVEEEEEDGDDDDADGEGGGEEGVILDDEGGAA